MPFWAWISPEVAVSMHTDRQNHVMCAVILGYSWHIRMRTKHSTFQSLSLFHAGPGKPLKCHQTFGVSIGVKRRTGDCHYVENHHWIWPDVGKLNRAMVQLGAQSWDELRKTLLEGEVLLGSILAACWGHDVPTMILSGTFRRQGEMLGDKHNEVTNSWFCMAHHGSCQYFPHVLGTSAPVVPRYKALFSVQQSAPSPSEAVATLSILEALCLSPVTVIVELCTVHVQYFFSCFITVPVSKS